MIYVVYCSIFFFLHYCKRLLQKLKYIIKARKKNNGDVNLNLKSDVLTIIMGASVPDPGLEIGGGSHPDPEMRVGGGRLQKFFSALGVSASSKNKGESGPLLLDPARA